MSRISETEFYNDKDVITQIEWLKNNIQADHIESVQVEQITDKGSEDYGLTTVKITMENGHEYKGEVISAILKDVRIQSGEDFNVMVFELANGETISTNIPLGSDSYWALIKGEPQSNTALKAWMDEKAEAVDLTNETRLRIRGDEALGQRITVLDRDVAGEIERIDGELADKADKSALEEETAKRTEADTGLLQAITEEETARKSADETEREERMEGDRECKEYTNEAKQDLLNQLSDKANRSEVTAETLAREEADEALSGRIETLTGTVNGKEDTANKVSAFQKTPSDDKYPSEKLVFDSTLKQHLGEITPTQPPGPIIRSIKEYGNSTTNTIDMMFEKVASLSSNAYVGHTDLKPIVQVNTAVVTVAGGNIGGFITTNGDIFIWSTVPKPATGLFGGVVATYTIKRD